MLERMHRRLSSRRQVLALYKQNSRREQAVAQICILQSATHSFRSPVPPRRDDPRHVPPTYNSVSESVSTPRQAVNSMTHGHSRQRYCVQSCGVVSRTENGGASEPTPMEGVTGNTSGLTGQRDIHVGSQAVAYRRDHQEVAPPPLPASRRRMALSRSVLPPLRAAGR